MKDNRNPVMEILGFIIFIILLGFIMYLLGA